MMTLVRHIYIPLDKPRNERRGLSERIVRRKLERSGWIVWRGGLINITREDEQYLNVQRKYEQLRQLLLTHHPAMLETLQYLCVVHHGMPDFLCYKNQTFKFIECKLGHEQLSERQKLCIANLQKLGFNVEVYKLVEPCTKVRNALVNIETGEKKVQERQMRLKA